MRKEYLWRKGWGEEGIHAEEGRGEEGRLAEERQG